CCGERALTIVGGGFEVGHGFTSLTLLLRCRGTSTRTGPRIPRWASETVRFWLGERICGCWRQTGNRNTPTDRRRLRLWPRRTTLNEFSAPVRRGSPDRKAPPPRRGGSSGQKRRL